MINLTTLASRTVTLKLCVAAFLLLSIFATAQDDGADPNDLNPQEDLFQEDAPPNDPFADDEPLDDPFAEPLPDEPLPDEPLPENPVPIDPVPDDGIGDLPEGVPLPDYLQPDDSQPDVFQPEDDTSSDEPLPDAPLPDGTTPEEFEGVPLPEEFQDAPAPDAPVPDAPAPDGVAPDAPTSDESEPEGVPVPQDAAPEGAPPSPAPSETTPPGTTPSETTPSETAPPSEGTLQDAPAEGTPAPDAVPAPDQAPGQAPAPAPDAVEIPVPSGPSLNLAQVLELSAQQTRVTTAQLELEEARQNLERRRADPLGLRVPLLEAEQRFKAAQTRYLNAYYTSARELVAAYTGLQLARQEQIRAVEALNLSDTLQKAAVIRQNNGSATALDVQEAQNRLELAQNDLTQSQDALALAEARLRSLVGSDVGVLEELPQSAFDTQLPPADVVGASGEQNPELLAASQASALAEATLNTLDPLYTSPAQLETARVNALSAQEALTRAESDFQLTIQGLYDDALSAQSACALRQISRDNALERLDLQKARVESGLLSELELRELELETLDAELDAFRVCRNYLGSLLDLQANSGLGSTLISAP